MKQELIDAAIQSSIDAFFAELVEKTGLKTGGLSLEAQMHFENAAHEVATEFINGNS